MLPALLLQIVSLSIFTSTSALSYFPIHFEHWESINGFERRDVIHPDVFHPAGQAELMYVYPKDESSMHFGNWTIIAPPDLRIILLERLESVTKSVDCHRDDGHMSLSFRSREFFQNAWDAWKFVNHKSELKFLMITNHAGCGVEHERHPYMCVQVYISGKSGF